MESARPLPEHVLGANCNILRPPFPLDSDEFRSLYEDAGRPFFRYPGGTVSNYLNHKTGFMDADKAGGRGGRYERNNENVKQLTGGKGFTAEWFIAVAQSLELQFVLVLNMCTMSLEENEEFLQELKSAGIEIPFIELGNELSFDEYEGFFESGEKYLKEARKLTKICRDVFPQVKISAVVPNNLYSRKNYLNRVQSGANERQTEWVRVLAADSNFFDAVSIHCYSGVGIDQCENEKDLPTMEDALCFGFSHTDVQFHRIVTFLEKTFPNKEIWVTEYGHKELKDGQLNSKFGLDSSFVSGLHNVAIMLHLLSFPSITIAHWHSMSKMTLERNGNVEVASTHDVFSFVRTTLKEYDSYVRPRLEGGGKYEGKGEYEGEHPCLETGFFFNSADKANCCLIVVNKSGQNFKVTELVATTSGGEVSLEVEEVEDCCSGEVELQPHCKSQRRRKQERTLLPVEPFSVTKILLKQK